MTDGFRPKLVSLLLTGPERADDIARLHATLFDEAWSSESVRKLMSNSVSMAMVATYGGQKQVVGFALAQMVGDEAEILTLGVAKPAQRHGIGRQLVEGLVRSARRAEVYRIYLDVAADNAAAIALYSKLGFEEAGRRRGYYVRKGSAAVDAVSLSLTLGLPAAPAG